MKKELVPEDLLKAIIDYSPVMVGATRAILKEGVTKYPIFVASRDKLKLGVPLIDGKEYRHEWNINASSAEEFFNKKIMDKLTVDQFRQHHKDPNKFFCIYLIDGDDLQILYVPIERRFLY